jgi:hypothetical protein
VALELPLERLQRWMQSAVVDPGSEPDALVGEVILPSRMLTPAERVEIYHGMYPLRMHDALAADYPGLEHFLGPRAFRRLVAEYVAAHPSVSYSLNPLGRHLPEFVATASAVKRAEFCAELARVELAVTEVFDAEETPAMTAEQIAAVPPEAWENARLVPIAALRLLALITNANAYLQTVRDEDHDHPKPRKKATWVVVYRRDFAVYRQELSHAAHDLLADLIAGQALGDAVSAALARGGKRAPREDELFRWFREWVSGGIFRSVSF